MLSGIIFKSTVESALELQKNIEYNSTILTIKMFGS